MQEAILPPYAFAASAAMKAMKDAAEAANARGHTTTLRIFHHISTQDTPIHDTPIHHTAIHRALIGLLLQIITFREKTCTVRAALAKTMGNAALVTAGGAKSDGQYASALDHIPVIFVRGTR